MDCRDGAVRHPLRRAVSRNGALMIATDITAPTMIAWTEPSPSSPAPAARRCAASGLDRSVRPGRVVGHAVDASLQCLNYQTTFTEISYTKLRTFPSGLPARQSSTLPTSEMWKRSHGRTTKAPPNERGGNGYVRPTTTAPHLDSTKKRRTQREQI